MADTNTVDVHVSNTKEGAERIREEVVRCFKHLANVVRDQGATRNFMDYCSENALPMIESFPEENENGVVQKVIVIEKQVKNGSEWVKQCQISVEIDADEGNDRLEQSDHLGCEVYFANKDACRGKTMSDRKAGKMELKMHAYLPPATDLLPHYRHQNGNVDYDAVGHPGSFYVDRARETDILCRCRIVTTRLLADH